MIKLIAQISGLERRLSTQTRLALSAGLLAVVVGALVGGACAYVSSEVLHDEIQRKAAGVAASAAANLDGDLVERLVTSGDSDTLVGWSLRMYLKATSNANPDIRRIYTLVPTRDLDTWTVVVDAADNVDQALPFGAAYDASGRPELRAALAHATAAKTIEVGPDGYLLAGYAPIRDHQGAPVGVVVVEVSADAFVESSTRVRSSFAASLALAALVAAFLGVEVARQFSGPVRDLVGATRRVAAGDLSISVPVGRGDELGELANGFNRMVRELRDGQDALQRLANTDSLTDLPNHRHAQEILTREVRLAARNARPLGVLMVDIDNFKLFNDSYGHLKGDEVIKLVAGVFAANVRDTDWVTRYAGDEFLVILPESDAAGTAAVARRVIAGLATQSIRDQAGLRIPITCSIGSATFPVDGQTESELIDLADRAMYETKRAGGNGHQAISEKYAEEKGKAGHGTFGVLDGLVTAVDNKDHYTREHSDAVTDLSLAIAQCLGLPAEQRNMVRIAGLLHDVGKIGIPNSILRKPAKLDDDEFNVMKQHPVLGAMIIQEVPHLSEVVAAVKHHHERFDGGGYPDGLSGEAIPLLARVLAVADAYSAMTSDRPYRKGLAQAAAIAELRRVAGTQLDPAVVETFLQSLIGVAVTADDVADPSRS